MNAEPQRLQQSGTIDPADIRWRVGQISKKDAHKGSLLGYIDARTCMEALDALDPQWSAVHGDPIIIGDELIGVPCTVTVNGISRSDVGMPSSQEPVKGAYSDALKRAAVHFGIGRELYELPRIYVKLDDYKKPVAIPSYRNGRWTLPSGAGSVFYDREPDEQPAARREFDEEAALRKEVQDAAITHGFSHAALSLMADRLGIPRGTRANVDQLREMLVLIQRPRSGVPAPIEPEQADAKPIGDAGSVPASSGLAPAQAPIDATQEMGTLTASEAVQPEERSAPAAPNSTLDLLRLEPSEFNLLAHLSATVYDGAPVGIEDVTEADLAEAVAAIGDTDWADLYGRFPAFLRAHIKGLGHSPADRAKRAKAKPDAEALQMGLEAKA
ncbi:MAG: hypothetical protein LC798_11190 [Chloroflexi bacterium]|nr:hypothetical protein [Chloroflexota bacterium]